MDGDAAVRFTELVRDVPSSQAVDFEPEDPAFAGTMTPQDGPARSTD